MDMPARRTNLTTENRAGTGQSLGAGRVAAPPPQHRSPSSGPWEPASLAPGTPPCCHPTRRSGVFWCVLSLHTCGPVHGGRWGVGGPPPTPRFPSNPTPGCVWGGKGRLCQATRRIWIWAWGGSAFRKLGTDRKGWWADGRTPQGQPTRDPREHSLGRRGQAGGDKRVLSQPLSSPPSSPSGC